MLLRTRVVHTLAMWVVGSVSHDVYVLLIQARSGKGKFMMSIARCSACVGTRAS